MEKSINKMLCKAKLKSKDNWICGYYFHSEDIGYILLGMTNGIPNMYKVIPESVCRYTGKDDKYGKKIFENDYVKWKFKRPWREEYHVSKVEWDDFYSAWKLTVPGGYSKMREDIVYEVFVTKK